MWSYDDTYQKKFGGVGFFDLESGSAYLFDHFTQFVPDGWPSAVEWSPNGQSFVFYSDGERTDAHHHNAGFWIVDINQKNIRQLVNLSGYCQMSWQPDSQWLAFSCYDSRLELGIWLIEIKTGKLLKTDLPSAARLINWINVVK